MPSFPWRDAAPARRPPAVTARGARRAMVVATCTLAAGPLAAGPLAAQRPASPATSEDVRGPARLAACRAAIPDLARHPTTVRLAVPTLPTMAAQPLSAPVTIPAAEQVVRWTADAIRGIVGSPAGTTAIDGLIAWHALEGVHATFTLDAGRLAWRVDGGRAGAPTPRDSTGLVLLAQALDAVRDSIATVVVPTDGVAAPPTFVLAFQWTAPPADDRARDNDPFDRPVFELRVPTFTPARPTGPLRPRYPERARPQQYQAEVRLLATIDEQGRVALRTVRVRSATATPVAGDMLPAGYTGMRDRSIPPTPLAPAEARTLFTQAAISALEAGRYEPARIGGCPTPQDVDVPFRFGIVP